MRIEYDNDATPLVRWLLTIIAVFALGDVLVSLLRHIAGVRVPSLVFLAFDLGEEGSLPTWFSSAQLLLAGALLGLTAQRKFALKDPHRWAWCLLAVGFCFLSLDETTSIHERWGRLASGVVEASGFFRFRWIAVALALLPPLLLVLWPLLRSLPPRVRAEFLVSGAIFLGGSVGLEGVGGLVASSGAGGGVWYDLLNVAENGAEVVGISLFIGALVRYVARTVPRPSTEADPSFGGAL